MVPALALSLLFFCFVLIKSADQLVISLRRLSKLTHTKVFALSAILLALGTSFPELFVAISSSLEGTSSLSFGNVLGANIANISLVAGFSALVAGRVNVKGGLIKKEVFMALVAALVPVALALDGKLSRVDGIILVVLYGAYAASLFRERFEEVAKEHKKESFIYRFLRRFNHIESARTKEFGRLFLGIAFLLFSSDVIVKIAKQIAVDANLPVFIIGLILVSIGTTLPEIAFSLKSVGDHEPTMFFGNILGSIIANSTLVVGVAATINPVELMAFKIYEESAITFLVVFALFWFFVKSKSRLDRWEALFLVLAYCVFMVVVFL